MSIITADQTALELVKDLKLVLQYKKSIDKRIEELKQQLYNHMNEHEELISDDGELLLSWKYASNSKVFDTKRFELEQPMLYKEYLADRDGSRRLIIK